MNAKTSPPVCSRATEFAVFCIENTAKRLGCTGSDVYQALAAVNGIDGFLYPSYETLHTQGRDYIVEETIGWLSDHVPLLRETAP